MRQREYFEAYLDDYDKITVYLSRNSYDGQSNRFLLKDNFGFVKEVTIQSIEQTPSGYNKYTLLNPYELEIGNEYYLEHQHGRKTILEYGYIVKSDRFDTEYFYDKEDLGYTYNENETSFALWAPTAYRVKLEISKHHVISTYEMKRDTDGVFRISILENLENATYVYFVRVNGKWQQSIDPYGIAGTANSERSAIVDIEKIKVKQYSREMMKSNCDAIIYEMSVRDFTMQATSGIQSKGKYLGVVEENVISKEKQTGFSYLKSLGITHIQLMPVFDFGSVDERYPLQNYNWGYDPMQYRCLEGSYANEPDNPYSRIFEFVKIVETCHEHNIRVNLDVVFNHVYDMDSSSFQKVVPNYYFQMNADGYFSNGTYCGNDFDTTRKMARKYVVDSCVFITKLYQIDGFRLDLMGILDIDTINEVHQKMIEINPNFMIYGEGWDMPSLLDQSKRASINNNWKMPYIAHFSDRFRDVTKGNTNEANVKGYCSGAVYLIEIMKNCLCASSIDYGNTKLFANPRNVVNYVECHDNMTSWDKLRECCKEDTREVRIKRHEMMIACVMLAQGIPFLHCGQEFARTKHGMGNTYAESDEINCVDYHRKDRYTMLVEHTKALIEIRRKYDVFHLDTSEEVQNYVSFDDIDHNVLVYKIKKDKDEVVVMLNPTSKHYQYPLPSPYELLYYNGKVENEAYQNIDIDAYATIVLSKIRK